jgi:predicted metal-dependent peptidase
MGKSSVEDEVPTAYTDGVNKKYGRKFLAKQSDAKVRGLVMHENGHIFLKHILRFKKEFLANPRLINAAADFVVNDLIMSISDKGFCELPEGGLYDPKFHNWSVREVYDYLLKQQKSKPKQGQGQGQGQGKPSQGQGQGQGQGKPSQGQGDGQPDDGQGDGQPNDGLGDGQPNDGLGTIDEHDFTSAEKLSAEEEQKLSGKIDRALREGGILAGRMGAKIPRAISELLEPKIDWREQLREFVTSSTRGTDEFTWRRFNKRLIANDIYMPSLENESIGELVVAIDTSGSIGSVELTEFASELASICDVCSPDKVRILWWDTQVHGEQVFTDNYANIASMLKPLGGGGTNVSSVSEYITTNKIITDGVIVMTDGYVESDIKWDISSPTLWLVTQRKDFNPPTGKVVKFDKEV